MAINIEPNIKQNLRLVDILYLQFRLYKVVKLIRSLLRKLLLPFHSIFSHHKINKNNYYNFNDNYIIKTDFVNLLEKYQKNKWIFIEDILNEEFWELINSNWPKKFYFNPGDSYYKLYNTGFTWRHKLNKKFNPTSDSIANPPYYLQDYKWLDTLVKHLNDHEFLKCISLLTGKKMICASGIVTDARYGHCVPLHQDSVSTVDGHKDRITMMIFISSADLPNSGELCLVGDNRWENIIFKPPSLNNTALFFNKSENFFHGFKPLDKGKFRKSIGVTFCCENDVGIINKTS